MKDKYPGRAITKEEKLLKGTYREDRHGPKEGSFEPEIATEIPAMPDDLEPYMQDAWNSITEQMQMAGILRITDFPMLIELMRAMQTMEECWKETKGKPTVKKVDKNGNTQIIKNPAHEIYQQAYTRFKDISGQFGLSPISRQKIRSYVKKKKEETPMNKIDKI